MGIFSNRPGSPEAIVPLVDVTDYDESSNSYGFRLEKTIRGTRPYSIDRSLPAHLRGSLLVDENVGDNSLAIATFATTRYHRRTNTKFGSLTQQITLSPEDLTALQRDNRESTGARLVSLAAFQLLNHAIEK